MTTWSSQEGAGEERGYHEEERLAPYTRLSTGAYTRVVDDTWPTVYTRPQTSTITTTTTTTSTTTTTTTTTTTKSSTTTRSTTTTTLAVTTARKQTTKVVVSPPRLVRRPCAQPQLSLDSTGWLELSSKLLPQKQNYRTEVTSPDLM